MPFCLFCIYLYSIINIFTDTHSFYVISCNILFGNRMHILIVDWVRNPTFWYYSSYFIFSLFHLSSDWRLRFFLEDLLSWINHTTFIFTFAPTYIHVIPHTTNHAIIYCNNKYWDLLKSRTPFSCDIFSWHPLIP